MDISTVITVLLYVLLGWFLYSRFAPVKGVKNLKADEFKNQLNNNRNKILIDVREPNEYREGYIPGAINIPLSQLKGRIGEVPKDKDIFLYCRSGMRSKQAARILSKKGVKYLTNLQGGILSWTGSIKNNF